MICCQEGWLPGNPLLQYPHQRQPLIHRSRSRSRSLDRSITPRGYIRLFEMDRDRPMLHSAQHSTAQPRNETAYHTVPCTGMVYNNNGTVNNERAGVRVLYASLRPQAQPRKQYSARANVVKLTGTEQINRVVYNR